MIVSLFLLHLLSCLNFAAAELWPEESFNFKADDVPIFKTEPDFKPVVLKVLNKTQDPSRLEPGLLWVAPHIFHLGFGPHLFTQDGQLVWYGQGVVGHFGGHVAQAMDFGPCDYLGERGTHLCFSEGRPKKRDLDPARRTGGLNRIFDNSYTQVGKDITRVSGYDPPNPHEFRVTPNADTFLQSIFHKRQMDLRPYRGYPHGYVYEPCFQEVDLETKKQLFRWCYLKYHPIWHTDVYLRNRHNTENRSTKTGGRGTIKDPWDFAHMNALDKNSEGDYLVSLRHMDQILMIAGPNNVHGVEPGQTLWRLGGKGQDVKFRGRGSPFSRQHHSRFVKTDATETVISVFDNAYDGSFNSSRFSSAKIISINNKTKTARLVKSFPHPYKRLSASQGSTHVYPSGNVFVGWGARPQLSEFAANGELLYHAQILPDPGNMTNYRSFKAPWIGRPAEKDIKLVPYCKSCNTFMKDSSGDPLIAYVSWNGATEVVEWRFHLSATGAYGPWISMGKFPKTGFETVAPLESKAFAQVASFAPWVSVQALDKNGTIIGTKLSRTFVPGPHLTNKCDENGCFEPKRFLYSESQSMGITCQISLVPMSTVLLLLCGVIEAGIYILNAILHRTSSPAWNAGVIRRQRAEESRPQRQRSISFVDDDATSSTNQTRHQRETSLIEETKAKHRRDISLKLPELPRP